MKVDDSFYLKEKLINLIKPYFGFSVKELKDKLNINTNPKNINSMIVYRIIKRHQIEENLIKENNIVIKTINFEMNNNLIESMNLARTVEGIHKEQWKTSELYNLLKEKTFLFIVFKKDMGTSILKNAYLWNMPLDEINGEVEKIWTITKNLILDGKIVNYIDKNGKDRSNFPKKTESKIIHVRPHARNKNDTFILPVSDKITGRNEYEKHSFWLNNQYIKKVIKNLSRNQSNNEISQKELEILLAYYMFDFKKKSKNIFNKFVQKYNHLFQKELNSQQITYMISSIKNIDPSYNVILNLNPGEFESNMLSIWKYYIIQGREERLKKIYNDFKSNNLLNISNLFRDDEKFESEIEKNILHFISSFKGDIVKEKYEIKNKSESKAIKRDPQVTMNALYRANYKCEYLDSHKTFIRKNKPVNYTEGHHLIPLEYQDQYQFNLDVEANVVSLCSHCHNQIHYGKDFEDILNKIYKERKERLKICGLNVEYDELVKMYM